MDLPSKATFRVGEVATFFDVSERTVRAWIASGRLGSLKIVGSVRIPRGAVLALCGPRRPDPENDSTHHAGAQNDA